MSKSGEGNLPSDLVIGRVLQRLKQGAILVAGAVVAAPLFFLAAKEQKKLNEMDSNPNAPAVSAPVPTNIEPAAAPIPLDKLKVEGPDTSGLKQSQGQGAKQGAVIEFETDKEGAVITHPEILENVGGPGSQVVPIRTSMVNEGKPEVNIGS